MRFRTAASCALAILFAAVVATAQSSDHKIDPRLLQVLGGDTNPRAPIFVLLENRANLKALSRIPDRAERGQAVVAALREKALASQASLVAQLRSQGVPFTRYWVENVVFIPNGDLELAQALARRPEVIAIVPSQSSPYRKHR